MTLFLAVSFSEAQLLLGPKFGATFSKQSSSEYETWKPGIQFGASLHYNLRDVFNLSGEFLVTQKGYLQEFDGSNSFDQLTATYIEVPGMARYLLSTGPVVLTFGGGVYYGFWQSGQYRSKLGEDQPVLEEDYEFVSDPIDNGYKDNRSDFGWMGGLGIRYDDIGSGLLFLEARYQQGLVSTNPVDTPPQGYLERKNQNIMISLTYLLYL
jgi:hypothetical protein